MTQDKGITKLLKVADDWFFVIYLAICWLMLGTVLHSYFEKYHTDHIFYTVGMTLVFLFFLAFKRHPFRAMGLNFSAFSGKMFLWMLPVSVITNAYIIMQSIYFFGDTLTWRAEITAGMVLYKIFGPIRTIGEEIIFRGWMFIKPEIMEDDKTFWGCNVIQAIIFTIPHALIPFDQLWKWIIWICFVMLLSLVYGCINRKFKSIWPSAILHSFNGFYGIFLVVG